MPSLKCLSHSITVGEGCTNPLGFHDATPTFSWKLPAHVKKQTAYRLQTLSDKTQWDSGWIESEQSTFVPYGGEPLASRQRVEWRVSFRDENGEESDWSESATFELGLLSAKDWTAKWIRPAQNVDTTTEPVGVLRRSFPIEKQIAQARLYVTARGLFAFHINGQRVGNDYFANGFTSYNHRLDTLTYDITSQLQTGENTIQGLLGAGWYAGRFPFETKNVGPYGKQSALLAQLEITYEDGSTQTIVSDEKWQGSFEGPIVSSSLYDGEQYDARRQITNWLAVIADADLGNAALTPKPFATVRELQTLVPQNISEPQVGRFVFDFGQNMVGWARIKALVEKDHTITLRFAEMLNEDGTLYTENYRTAKSTDTYTAAETGIVEWEPQFTFHGFRYVEISGLSEEAKPQKDWVKGVVLTSDLTTTGRFTSSHAKLNQLQSNILWGWRGNSLDIPTDCPQRDERAGWTGDAQVFCATALFNTDSHAFWKSWLGSMRDDQDADGLIPDIIPSANARWRGKSPGWLDAATIIPWEIYVRTGDSDVLAENFSMMEKLVGWYRSQSTNGLLPSIKGCGDWLQPYPNVQATPEDRMGDRRGDTPLPLVGVAFYARSLQILADSARVLGREEEAKRYDNEAASIRAAFSEEYFNTNGKLQNASETQTAYVLAIAFDLIPAHLKPKAGKNLVRLVREAGTHLRTGFLGTPYLATALDQTGHADLALELLFQETYPSWFYSINQGATTMWERWNSYTRDGGFGDVSMNSFNHYAYGAIGQWMYERIAGLAPDSAHAGYKHFFVRPLFAGQLDSAKAELETPYGKASSAWKKRDGKIVMEVVVPPNTTATIDFPNGRESQTVAAGTHHFECALYDARINGREALTPPVTTEPRITGAAIFGVRPDKPLHFRVCATGEKPLEYCATGLPSGVTIDAATGWISGRAPEVAGDIVVNVEVRNAKGSSKRDLTIRVGETLCLTPPMGWNSWYVHSEGVSDAAIREIASAMESKGLTSHGWTYLNIDDCWMGLRNVETKAIAPNDKFGDMKSLAGFVNGKGLKLGIYSTPWMSTYAGYIGGSAPNEAGDYAEFFLPEEERQNPHQLFGRYPNGIRKGLAKVGPVWLVDRDARQFAEWGIDYVKYDWKDWTLELGDEGYWPSDDAPQQKSEGITKRVHDDFRALDRDIVISLSPDHNEVEDEFVPKYSNLWRLTGDIRAEWRCLIAPFAMEDRLQHTRSGHYGDLDMLQIGPLGKPNRAEVVFTPSPLTPAEQYFQVTLWCILTQPLLLSCNVPTMDEFDLNLVTNDEVLAVNQDPLCKQGYRVANEQGVWEIWAKDLADGSKAVALFNLSEYDQTLHLSSEQLGMNGQVRDLWRQKEVGLLSEELSVSVSAHGAAFFRVSSGA